MTRLTKMPADMRPVHFCPVCRTAYDDDAEAATCAATGIEHPFTVGDIVTEAFGRFHWHDGPDHWVHSYENPGGSPEPKSAQIRTDARGARKFYWVVTAVGCYADVHPRQAFNGYPGDHKPIYWVKSLGICNGIKTGRCGWTSQDTHERFVKIETPPALVLAESLALLGERTPHLL